MRELQTSCCLLFRVRSAPRCTRSNVKHESRAKGVLPTSAPSHEEELGSHCLGLLDALAVSNYRKPLYVTATLAAALL